MHKTTEIKDTYYIVDRDKTERDEKLQIIHRRESKKIILNVEQMGSEYLHSICIEINPAILRQLSHVIEEIFTHMEDGQDDNESASD